MAAGEAPSVVPAWATARRTIKLIGLRVHCRYFFKRIIYCRRDLLDLIAKSSKSVLFCFNIGKAVLLLSHWRSGKFELADFVTKGIWRSHSVMLSLFVFGQ